MVIKIPSQLTRHQGHRMAVATRDYKINSKMKVRWDWRDIEKPHEYQGHSYYWKLGRENWQEISYKLFSELLNHVKLCKYKDGRHKVE